MIKAEFGIAKLRFNHWKKFPQSYRSAIAMEDAMTCLM